MEQNKPLISDADEVKKSSLVLSDEQKLLYIRKILPLLCIGSFIWLMSEILFTSLFQFNELSETFYLIYPLLISFFLVLYSIYFILSKYEKHNLSIIAYFITCFLAGSILLPVSLFLPFLLIQVHMFVFLIFATNCIVLVMSVILGKNFLSKNTLWLHIFSFIGLMVIVEVIFVILFNIHNYLLTIPLITSEILAVGLLLLYYGPVIIKKTSSSSWSLIQFKLQSYFLFVLAGLLITAIVVLIIIVLSILAGDVVDLAGFGDFFHIFTPIGERRKEAEEVSEKKFKNYQQ